MKGSWGGFQLLKCSIIACMHSFNHTLVIIMTLNSLFNGVNCCLVCCLSHTLEVLPCLHWEHAAHPQTIIHSFSVSMDVKHEHTLYGMEVQHSNIIRNICLRLQTPPCLVYMTESNYLQWNTSKA